MFSRIHPALMLPAIEGGDSNHNQEPSPSSASPAAVTPKKKKSVVVFVQNPGDGHTALGEQTQTMRDGNGVLGDQAQPTHT